MATTTYQEIATVGGVGHQADSAVQLYELRAHELWTAGNSNGMIEFCICRGQLWATVAGDSVDYILREGERGRLPVQGLVMEALSEVRFQVQSQPI